ncbi:Uncharacterised protein [Klebsiella pneumoniae]|uniref:InsA N-terminal zinc ribbon domain-containing protein n=1 Tax=Klebsiella pneumoniae TaxID=573 RepID=A0A3S4IQL8_KLEPN|nr:Uncharacterised protein [Klebsiella pneumoniae]
MDTLFTINACKTFGCRNLGLPSAAEYHFPNFRLGYPALYCAACGSYPPLFNEREFRPWLAAYLTDHARRYGYLCPVCYQRDIIRYGRNPQGTQRLQCRHCKKVWTPKFPHIAPIEAPRRICSVPLIAPFQGNAAGQKLYFLLSFDAVRGNVIHLTSNFTPFALGESLRYHWRGGQADREETDDIIQRISLTEMRFLQRSQFDEIQYGSAMQKRHARGNILRPVIAAHGHFKLLSQRFPEVKTHVIAHECFLRGAAIVAWAPLFRQRQGDLWYVEEEIRNPASPAPWQLQGKNPSWLVAKLMAALDAGRESENGLPACRHCRREHLSTRPCGQPTVYNMAEKQTRVCAERPVFRRARNANSGLTGSRV